MTRSDSRYRSRWVAVLTLATLAPFAGFTECASAQGTAVPAGSTDAGSQATAAPAATPAAAATPGIRWEKTVPKIVSGKWTGKRLPDGQPDIQGDWSNTIANHDNFTDPQGGIPGDPATRNRARNKGPRDERAPSRISDPADGQVPFQPWARAKQQEFLANFFGASKPEYTEPLARCWPAGIPKSFYWHGYEIRQYPGYVLFLFNSGNRIVYLDKKQHLAPGIRQWSGDSIGHWEGNTLVVDVTNNNSKARFGRTGEFASENVHITERFIFDNDGKRYNYEATFDDPTVYTRPWTATIPARRYTVKDQPDEWHFEVTLANNPGKEPIVDHYERMCVENNGPFGQLSVTTKK